MGAGACIEGVLRFREVELLEEGPVHLVRVMLPGVEDEVVDPLGIACPNDRRHLDDLRPGAENDGDHRRTSGVGFAWSGSASSQVYALRAGAPPPCSCRRCTIEYRIIPTVPRLNPRIRKTTPPEKRR